MKRSWIILLGAIAWGFLMIPGSALAHPHSGAHSPFDAPKAKKSLHCLLLKHQHAALPFCPHTRHARSAEAQFKADCGDSPNGTPAQIQWSKILMLCPSIAEVTSCSNEYFLPRKLLRLPSPYDDFLEKPPQHA